MRLSVLSSSARPVALGAGSLLLVLSGAGVAAAAPGAATHTRPGTAARSGPGELGRWTVAAAAPGSYRLTWHSPTAIPVTDAAVQVRHAGSLTTATLGADGRTASVVVSSTTPPDPAAYDVVLGSRVLDRRGGGPSVATTSRTPYRAPVTRALRDDPGQPGTHAITTSDYQLDPVKLPGIRRLSEMVGHVVAPVDATDSSPLVLFLHGRHEPCYRPTTKPGGSPTHGGKAADPRAWSCPKGQLPVPSYLGYDYVQRTLASQGYVTVSISADAINALDWQDPDGGAQDRAALIRDHLLAWVDFVHDGTHPADLSDVILVGHSRGGEGVDRASLNLPDDEGYRIRGQVLIGPTDFGFQAAPAMPTVTLLPYCDGDVSDLQGQNFTDDGRDITADPTGDLAFHSSVLVMGADHNFFNSEWTPGISTAPSQDDWGGNPRGACGSDTSSRLSAGQQRKVGRAYIAGAVHLFADGDTSVLPMFDGSPVSVPSAGNADVRTHALGGGLVTMRPGIDGSAADDSTAAARLCVGVSDSEDTASCQPKVGSSRTPQWPSEFYAGVPHRQFLDVGWKAAGRRGGMDLAQPWDLSSDSRLDLRTIVDPRRGPIRVDVSLTDADGHTAVVTPVGGGNLDPLPSGSYSLAKRWGQDLRVPLTGVSGIDLSRVTQVGLVSRSQSGRVFVADFSATPTSGLSVAPTQAVPLFSIDTVRQPEGNGTDPVTVDVPWHVTGVLDHDATVRIVRSNGKSQTLVIPAHTSSGVLPVSYRPNDLDDEGQRFIGLTAYGVSGVETDDYLGGVSIVDDDPTPAVTVAAASHRIKAGQQAVWTVTLDKPVNYWAYAEARPVRSGNGPQLRVGDLTKKFRDRFIGDRLDPATPLWRSRVSFYVEIRRHHTSGSFTIPTRPGLGAARTLSLEFSSSQLHLDGVVRSVKVAPHS